MKQDNETSNHAPSKFDMCMVRNVMIKLASLNALNKLTQ